METVVFYIAFAIVMIFAILALFTNLFDKNEYDKRDINYYHKLDKEDSDSTWTMEYLTPQEKKFCCDIEMNILYNIENNKTFYYCTKCNKIEEINGKA
jgi:hypothetical protein